MARDPKRTVADGYDVIADAYASWGLRAEDPVKRRFAQLAIDSAEAGSPALDLGCGTGEHVTRVLTGHSDDWVGAPMYWSHFDAETNVALVESAGLAIESDELVVADEDGDPFTHQWIVARRP